MKDLDEKKKASLDAIEAARVANEKDDLAAIDNAK